MLRNGLLMSQNKSVNSIQWDTADHLFKASPITSSTGELLFSMWFKVYDTTAVNYIFEGDGVSGFMDASFFQTEVSGSIAQSGGDQFRFDTITDPITEDTGWHHLLISLLWDDIPANRLRHIYIDDVDVGATGNNVGAAFNYWNIKNIFKIDNGGFWQGFEGESSEVYITDEYLDITVESNRRKFVLSSVRPAELGSDGSTPTGTQPLIYLKGDASNAGVNSGSGGDFTVSGTPVDASTNPWD